MTVRLFATGLVAVALFAAVAGVPAEDPAPPPPPVIRMATFNDARIEQVLMMIGQQAGVTIQPLGSVAGSRITIAERDVDLETLLNRIVQPQGWVWFKLDDGQYAVADEAWYKKNELPKKVVEKVYELEHLAPSQIEKAVVPVMTSGISSIMADDAAMKLVVTDLPEVQKRVDRLIRELDMQIPADDLARRQAETEERARKLEEMKAKVRAEAPSTAAPAETAREAVAATDAPRRSMPPISVPRLTGSWKDTPMQQFLDDVARTMGTGISFEAHGAAVGATVTVEADNREAMDGLCSVLAEKGLLLCPQRNGSTRLVCDADWYSKNGPGEGILEVEVAPALRDPEDMARWLRSAVTGEALVSLDADGKNVRIKGPAGVVRHLETWAHKIDYAVSKPMTREERLRTHEERVRYIIETRRLARMEEEGAATAPASGGPSSATNE